MKYLAALTALAFAACANVTPAQQANIDKAVAAGIDLATQVAKAKLESTKGLAK